jgi:hypothetical protein
MTWNEELFDHKRRLEISALTIHGLKKTRYNSVDYGTVVFPPTPQRRRSNAKHRGD